MQISLYTFVRNGLRYDFHVEAMLRHHVPFVDEIIVDEGMSTDRTYDVIKDIHPRIKVFRNEWDRGGAARNAVDWYTTFKNRARRNCTGDWCILLDCDEFIPEWEFERLRSVLTTTRHDILAVRMVHFYGNYRVFQARTDRLFPPRFKHIIHRNLPTIEVWGDGSDVRSTLGEALTPAEQIAVVDVHHFGEVRHAARLRQKWREQTNYYREGSLRKSLVPGFVFDLLPHRWTDSDILPHLHRYDGPFIQAVRDDPDEFVRDGFATLAAIEERDRTRAR